MNMPQSFFNTMKRPPTLAEGTEKVDLYQYFWCKSTFNI